MSNNFSFNESCRVNVVLMKFLRNCTFQPKFKSTYRTAILKVRTVRTSHLRVREGMGTICIQNSHGVEEEIIKESYIGQKLEDMNGSNSPMYIVVAKSSSSTMRWWHMYKELSNAWFTHKNHDYVTN